MDNNTTGFVNGADDQNKTNTEGTENQQLFDMDGRKVTADEFKSNREELLRSYTKERQKNAEYEQKYGNSNQPTQPVTQAKDSEEVVDPNLKEVVNTLSKGGVVTTEQLNQLQSQNQNMLRAVMIKTSADRFADHVNESAKIPELKVKPDDLASYAVQHNYVDEKGQVDFQAAYDAMTWKIQLEHKEDIDKSFGNKGIPSTVGTNSNPTEAQVDLKDEDTLGQSINKILDAAGWK